MNATTQNLNPQCLKPGETCAENAFDGEGPTFYYLGFACGTSVWRKGLAWTAAERERAKTENCGLCCCCDD